jgi:hypothetical protein
LKELNTQATMSNNQQLDRIVNPHPNDVISGRGKSVNRHPGNEHFRSLVKSYKEEYVAVPKSQKKLYSKIIYDEIRSMNPPGRFLKQDPATKLWSDVGHKTALAKIRQALREGAPEMLRDLQTVEAFKSVHGGTPSSVDMNLNGSSSFQRSSSDDSLYKLGLMSVRTKLESFPVTSFAPTSMNDAVSPSCVSTSRSPSLSGEKNEINSLSNLDGGYSNLFQQGQMQAPQQTFNQNTPQIQPLNVLLQLQNALNQVASTVNQQQSYPGPFNNRTTNTEATGNMTNFQSVSNFSFVNTLPNENNVNIPADTIPNNLLPNTDKQQSYPGSFNNSTTHTEATGNMTNFQSVSNLPFVNTLPSQNNANNSANTIPNNLLLLLQSQLKTFNQVATPETGNQHGFSSFLSSANYM